MKGVIVGAAVAAVVLVGSVSAQEAQQTPGEREDIAGVRGTFYYEPGVPGHMESWILIPGEVVMLKDFFEIAAVFVNRAETLQPTDEES